MTQANPILGANLSGLTYRTQDNSAKQALLNHHLASTAPSYAEAGVIWIDNTATPWILKVYDGADWIALGEVNATTNTFLPYIGGAGVRVLNHATDTGAANAYAIAPSPAIAAYTTGQMVTLKPANANTGASTLAVNGLTAKNIKLLDSTNPAANAMVATGVYALVYDGTNFVLLNPAVTLSILGAAALGAAQTFTGAQRGSVSTLTDGATITPDFSLANNYKVQLGGNRTLANPTNLAAGQSGDIDIYQDAAGSRTLAYAWGWQFSGGSAPTLSTAGATKDTLYYDVQMYHIATVTITIATPSVITNTAHGLLTGQKVQLTTTGALPTGLSASTTYFVVYVDANSYSLATSLANAAAGTKMATSSSQSGTHTLTALSISATLLKAFS